MKGTETTARALPGRLHSILLGRISRNIGWLFLFQGSTYLSYLIAIPWLTHTLPVAEYGAVMAVMAAAQFCFIVTDYGFSASATYEVSCQRRDAPAVQTIIENVHGAKVILVALCCAGLWLLSYVPSYTPYRTLVLYAGISVALHAYQPIWLLQGLENMRAYAVYMIAGRLTFVAAVVGLVRSPGDGGLVLIAFALSNLLGTALGLQAMKRSGFRVTAISLRGGLQLMCHTAGYFGGCLAFALYSSMNSVALGAVSLRQAGVFSAAEQIYKAGQSVGGPISQAMLPALAHSRDTRLIQRMVPMLAGLLGLGCAIFAAITPWVVKTALGAGYNTSIPVLYIFLATIPVTITGMVLGYPWFAALGSPGTVNTTSIVAAGLHVGLLSLLWATGALTAYNVALCVLATESLMLLLRIIFGIALTRKTHGPRL